MVQLSLDSVLCQSCRYQAHNSCRQGPCACPCRAAGVALPEPRTSDEDFPVCGPCFRGWHRRCLEGDCDCAHRADPVTRASESLEQLVCDLRAVVIPEVWAELAAGPLAVVRDAIPTAEDVTEGEK